MPVVALPKCVFSSGSGEQKAQIYTLSTSLFYAEMVVRIFILATSHQHASASLSAGLTAEKTDKPKMPKSSSFHHETQMTNIQIMFFWAHIPHLPTSKPLLWSLKKLYRYIIYPLVNTTCEGYNLVDRPSNFQTPSPCQRNSTGQARTNPTSNETSFCVFGLWNKPHVNRRKPEERWPQDESKHRLHGGYSSNVALDITETGYHLAKWINEMTGEDDTCFWPCFSACISLRYQKKKHQCQEYLRLDFFIHHFFTYHHDAKPNPFLNMKNRQTRSE